MDLTALVASQRAFFSTGATLPVETRIAMLKKLYAAIRENEAEAAL